MPKLGFPRVLSLDDRQQALALFPLPLRRRANRVLDATELRDRNESVLRFGLDCMKYFAALAFADYRREGVTAPSPTVERLIGQLGGDQGGGGNRSTAGSWKELFVQADQAASRPGLFDRKAYSRIRSREICELRVAMEALSEAVDISGQSVGPLLRRRLHHLQGDEKESWFVGWDLLVSYRNKTAHDDVYGWLELSDFYESVTPYLEAAVVATFLHPAIADVLDHAPVWELTRVERKHDTFRHAFVQEPNGMNIRRGPIDLSYSLLERWNHQGWKAHIGSEFVIRGADLQTPEPILFHDFLTRGIPERLPEVVGRTAPEGEPHTTSGRTANQKATVTHAHARPASEPDATKGQREFATIAADEAPASSQAAARPPTTESDQFHRVPDEEERERYLEDLPKDVRQRVRDFVDQVAVAGADVLWDDYPRVRIPTTGRPRMLVSLERRTWYLQTRRLRGVSDQPIKRASAEMARLRHVKAGLTYPSFSWRAASLEEIETFLAIAVAYVRDVIQELEPHPRAIGPRTDREEQPRAAMFDGPSHPQDAEGPLPKPRQTATCRYCGRTHPATAQFWFRNKTPENGPPIELEQVGAQGELLHLRGRCKVCEAEYRSKLRGGFSGDMNETETGKPARNRTQDPYPVGDPRRKDAGSTRFCTNRAHEGDNPLPATEESFPVRKSGPREGTFVGWCRACQSRPDLRAS
jgi:hypothetical protein